MGVASVNHRRVHRIMQAHSLLRAWRYALGSDHAHGGKVVTLRSDLRGGSDRFELTCWSGDVVRGAFIIDAHDREGMTWCAVANAGTSAPGSTRARLATSSSRKPQSSERPVEKTEGEVTAV